MSASSAPSREFLADPGKCITCGLCVRDCPARVIAIQNGKAVKQPEYVEDCIECQHCLAICPTEAVTVGGRIPSESIPVGPFNPEALDMLIRCRRSFRFFKDEPVSKETVDWLLASVAHAPTGVNARHRRFTIIRDAKLLAEFRDRACRLLAVSESRLPEEVSWLAKAATEWLDNGRDVIFRNAPHLIVATAGPEASTKVPDCLIALSYFDLLAQAKGVGTVWVGMVYHLLENLPEARKWLDIPDDHTIGYAMLFGLPSFSYARTTQHEPEDVKYLEKLY